MTPVHLPAAPPPPWRSLLSLPVIVAALGYFVDIYDLVLVGMVGKASVMALGVAEADAPATVLSLLAWQMIGMLVGGFLWGMLADRVGRMATLFGSIITYSLATGANGFVDGMWQYYALRIIAGIGLAGELGTGITLVCESLPRSHRALGSTIVACVGIAGAVAAWLATTNAAEDWRLAYWIGGGMGLALLALRVAAHESELFARIDAKVPRGSLRMLFGSGPRIVRYLRSVLLGATTWFVVGMFVFGAPLIARAIGVVDAKQVTSRDAILWCYVGLIAGDLVAGLVSHRIGSRRRTIGAFLAASMVLCAVVLCLRGIPAQAYIALCGALGFTAGFWALFVTVAAEQFGTNLRATVATTAPNVARGLLYPIQAGVAWLAVSTGHLWAVAIVGAACFACAWWAVATIEETHGKDLDFLEELP